MSDRTAELLEAILKELQTQNNRLAAIEETSLWFKDRAIQVQRATNFSAEMAARTRR